MLTVHVPAGVTPRQIDIPEGVERSRKGSLHFTPISTIELTEAEMKHLEKAEPALHRQLIVFGPSPSLADKVRNDPALAKKMAEGERAKAPQPEVAAAAIEEPELEVPPASRPKRGRDS